MLGFDENYWTDRYRKGLTQWDAGKITTPIKEFFDQLPAKEAAILLPGGGGGHEAAYLHRQGFQNVYLLDFSPLPLQQFRQQVPDFPEEHLLCQDFFQLQGAFDFVVEQTFFCALHPSLRPAYAQKVEELLKKEGRLVGVLFESLPETGEPPFGGSREEYLGYFSPLFKIRKLERCYNSIKPRAGRELWLDLEK